MMSASSLLLSSADVFFCIRRVFLLAVLFCSTGMALSDDDMRLICTDTAFWKPYETSATTYALINFDAPKPLKGCGMLAEEGKLIGGAKKGVWPYATYMDSK